MKLDYISNVNEYGDNIVRLYNFDKILASRFRDLILEIIISKKQDLNLKDIDFITERNCNLVLRISEEDLGISQTGKGEFSCELTAESYEKMANLIEPFCKRDTKGYQWLYDVDSQTDLLFSPGGTW